MRSADVKLSGTDAGVPRTCLPPLFPPLIQACQPLRPGHRDAGVDARPGPVIVKASAQFTASAPGLHHGRKDITDMKMKAGTHGPKTPAIATGQLPPTESRFPQRRGARPLQTPPLRGMRHIVLTHETTLLPEVKASPGQAPSSAHIIGPFHVSGQRGRVTTPGHLLSGRALR